MTITMLDEVRVSSQSLFSGQYVPSQIPYDTNKVLVLPESGENGDIAIKSSVPVGDMRVGGARPTYPAIGDIFIPVTKSDNEHIAGQAQQYQEGGWVEVDASIYKDGDWYVLKGADLKAYTFDEDDFKKKEGLKWDDFLDGADELAKRAGLGDKYVSSLVPEGFEPDAAFDDNEGFPGDDEGGIDWGTFWQGVDALGGLAGLAYDWFSGTLDNVSDFIPDVDFDTNTGFPSSSSGGNSGGSTGGIDWGDGSLGDILSGLLDGLVSIGPMLLGVIAALWGLLEFVGNFGGFIGEALAFIPAEILSIMTIGLTLAVILMIIRFVRG